jgi:PAS domain S-box-containing protein
MRKPRKFGGFFAHVSEYYSEVLNQTSFSKQFTHFRNLLVVLEVVMYTFNAFFASSYMSFDSGSSIYSFIKYIRFESLEQVGVEIYLIIRLIVAIFLILNFLLFFIVIHLRTQSALWNRIRNSYFIFNVIIGHVLYIPLMELMVKRPFEIGHFSKDFNPIDVVCIVGYILMTLQGLQVTYFFQFEFLQKGNFASFPNPNTLLAMFVTLCVIGIECMIDYANIGIAAFIIFAVLTGIQAVLGFVYFFKSYISDHEQIQGSLFYIYMIYFSVVAALLTTLILPSVNFIPVFFCCLLLGFIFAWQRNNFKLRSRMDITITSIALAIIKLDFIVKLAKKCIVSSGTASFQASVQLKGLLKEHEYYCTNINCECHDTDLGELNESKGSNNTNTQRFKDSLKTYVRGFLVQSLRELISNHAGNFYYRYLLAIFYLRRIKNRVMANICAIELSSLNLSQREKVRLLALRKNIHQVQRNLNMEIFKNKNFEDLVEIQEKYFETLTLVTEIFNKMTDFWQNVIRNQTIDKDNLLKKGTHILELKSQLKRATASFKEYELQNDYLVLLMDFIRKEIFNAKIQLKYDDQSFNDARKISLVFEQNTNVLTDRFYSNFVQNAGVVLILGFDQGNIGHILKSSDGIKTIFGYEKQEVLGKNVHILMPKEIGQCHDEIFSRAFRYGKFAKNIHELNSFSVRKDGELMRVKVMIKMNIGIDSSLEMVGLIIPTVPDAEERYYMICDHNGFVTHASSELVHQFNIPWSKLEDGLFNVGMLNINLLEYLPVKPTIFANSLPQINSGTSFLRQQDKKDQKIFALSNFENNDDDEQVEKLFKALRQMQPSMLHLLRSGKTVVRFKASSQAFEVLSINDQQDDHYMESSPSPSHRSNVMATRRSVDKDTIFRRLTSFGRVLFNLIKMKKQESLVKNCQATIEFEDIEMLGKPVLHVFNFQKIIDLKIKQRMSGTQKRESLINKNSINCLESPRKLSQIVNDSSLNSVRKASENGNTKEASITNLFKKPQNLFYKEANEIPSKNYNRIWWLISFLVFIVAYLIINEIVYLINFKQPIASDLAPTKEEYRLISDFESNIKGTYNFLLNKRMADFGLNSTSIFASKITTAKSLMLESSIRKHVFNPDYNPVFNATYMFDVTFAANNAFLVENFLFEMTSYIFNTENITRFGKVLHEVYVDRFNVNLFPFFSGIETRIQANFDENVKIQLNSFTIMSYIFLLTFSTLIIFASIYQLRVIRNIMIMADPFLYIDDRRIDQITAYLSLAVQHFKKRFDPQADAESFLIPERSIMFSQQNMNEKRRQWKNQNSLSWCFMFLYFGATIIVLGLFCCIYYFVNQWEISLMRSLVNLQMDGIKILNDRNGLLSMTMHAKDYYLYPESFTKLNQTYVNRLKSLIFLEGSFSDDSAFSDSSLSDMYKGNFCTRVNQTQIPISIPCQEIFKNILMNNIPTIKNILSSKLNFLFKRDDLVNYNYTSWQAEELDRLSLYIENGLNTMYAHWETAFENKISQVSTIQKLICIVVCLLVVALVSAYAFVVVMKFHKNYRMARKLFLHLIPDDTLYKNKMIMVQLSKAGIFNTN